MSIIVFFGMRLSFMTFEKPKNIFFFTKFNFEALNVFSHRFFGCWVDCAYQNWASVTWWHPNDLINDLKWPILNWKRNFFTKFHFWACNMSFHRFFGCWVDCAHQIWVSSRLMTSKWPLNDLKWPIRTWKHNFLTKSHFGTCNMSFHRFFWTLSRLRLSDLSFESLNDL